MNRLLSQTIFRFFIPIFLLGYCFFYAPQKIHAVNGVTTLYASNFTATIQAKKVAVVAFTLSNCGACDKMKSSNILADLAYAYKDNQQVTVNILEYNDKNTEITDKYAKAGFPALVMFVNGKPTDLQRPIVNSSGDKVALLTSWKGAISKVAPSTIATSNTDPATQSSTKPTSTGSGGATSDTKPAGKIQPPIECRGVLVKTCPTNLSFGQYLELLLKELIPLILFLAMIMIAWAGVQYMLSGFKPENATKAKQRIVGIVVGAVFLMSIGVIINWVSPDIKIDKDAGTSTQKTP